MSLKPIIIYTDNKNKLTLTKEEFEEYIKKAFDQGYSEGYSNGLKVGYTPITLPSITYRNDTTPINYTKITCDATNSIGD